ncbi:hypothetical protein FUAX_28360 [Fulvitalea axinellae]|uniref:Sulfotransferase family protein n=1 Tax=Fulvitalea axinellae TaxID=1182444 RepID=A0AAU9CV83_9BACT|nr:hypothetical protein FUAX_28360 [Fulvitalea axinellae]
MNDVFFDPSQSDFLTDWTKKHENTESDIALRNDSTATEYEEIAINEAPIFIIGFWQGGGELIYDVIRHDSQFGSVSLNATSDKNFTDFLSGKTDFLQELITPSDTSLWEADCLRLAQKTMKLSGRKRFLCHNPGYMNRLELITDLFPDAKFVRVFRNPQSILERVERNLNADENAKNRILQVYDKMYSEYEAEKLFVLPENLVEIPFEEFEVDSMNCIKRIYSKLEIPGFERAEAALEYGVSQILPALKEEQAYSDKALESIISFLDNAQKSERYDPHSLA